MKLIIITTIFGAFISITHSSSLNLKKCMGVDNISIVGGYNASIEDFPYQVGIYFDEIFYCGGSIISEMYILTAAHCLSSSRYMGLSYVVRAGSELKNKGIAIHIAEAISHPDFHKIPDKDVALLKTKDPIQFSNVIKPVKLPPKGRHLKDESTVTVSGWGDIWNNSTVCVENDGLLRALDTPVFNWEKCREIYVNESIENSWCGGGTEKGGKGFCSGDSGGPAVQDHMVVGIVSAGFPCAYPNMPDVYTNVAAPAIRDFIKEHTGL